MYIHRGRRTLIISEKVIEHQDYKGYDPFLDSHLTSHLESEMETETVNMEGFNMHENYLSGKSLGLINLKENPFEKNNILRNTSKEITNISDIRNKFKKRKRSSNNQRVKECLNDTKSFELEELKKNLEKINPKRENSIHSKRSRERFKIGKSKSPETNREDGHSFTLSNNNQSLKFQIQEQGLEDIQERNRTSIFMHNEVQESKDKILNINNKEIEIREKKITNLFKDNEEPDDSYINEKKEEQKQYFPTITNLESNSEVYTPLKWENTFEKKNRINFEVSPVQVQNDSVFMGKNMEKLGHIFEENLFNNVNDTFTSEVQSTDFANQEIKFDFEKKERRLFKPKSNREKIKKEQVEIDLTLHEEDYKLSSDYDSVNDLNNSSKKIDMKESLDINIENKLISNSKNELVISEEMDKGGSFDDKGTPDFVTPQKTFFSIFKNAKISEIKSQSKETLDRVNKNIFFENGSSCFESKSRKKQSEDSGFVKVRKRRFVRKMFDKRSMFTGAFESHTNISMENNQQKGSAYVNEKEYYSQPNFDDFSITKGYRNTIVKDKEKKKEVSVDNLEKEVDEEHFHNKGIFEIDNLKIEENSVQVKAEDIQKESVAYSSEKQSKKILSHKESQVNSSEKISKKVISSRFRDDKSISIAELDEVQKQPNKKKKKKKSSSKKSKKQSPSKKSKQSTKSFKISLSRRSQYSGTPKKGQSDNKIDEVMHSLKRLGWVNENIKKVV